MFELPEIKRKNVTAPSRNPIDDYITFFRNYFDLNVISPQEKNIIYTTHLSYRYLKSTVTVL